MRYGLLGALEVDGANLSTGIRPGKPAALLALLLLQRNRAVGLDRLIEGLWGDDPPQTARKTLQLYVSQLRKALPPGTLETKSTGYVLHVAPGELDVDRFTELVAAGQAATEAGDHALAARAVSDALALWRGPALADFTYEDFAQNEIRRLGELRLSALEERIDADLALGRQARLVDELEQLVATNPLRERFRAQLMLTLYRCGRQADALEVYRDGRRTLQTELGIEPGPETRRLEQAILAHDPSLTGWPTPRVSARHPAGRRPLFAIVTGAIALVALVGWLAFGRFTGSGSTEVLTAANSAVLIGKDGRLGVAIPVGNSPAHALHDGAFLWTSNEQDGTVSRIDPRTRSVETIPVGRSPEGMAAAGGDLWVAAAGDSRLVEVDPRAGKPVRAIDVGNGPVAVAARGNELWVANSVDGTLTTVDATAGRVTRVVPVGSQPTAVVVGAGSVWVALAGSGSVVELNRDGSAPIQSINVGDDPVALAVSAGRVWVANRLDGTVSEIDAASGSVDAAVPVGGRPTALAVGEGKVWVTLAEGRVVKLDAGSVRPLLATEVGSEPAAAVADGSGAWLTTLAQPATHRGGTLRVEADPPFACSCADPLDVYSASGWQLMHLVYDGLLTYRSVAGPAGATLVGDLAEAVPTPSPDGRTYVFRLRPGIHFSNGRLARPGDVRASFVRFFRVHHVEFLPAYFTRIEGAEACGNTGRCDTLGVVADDRSGTVTFHLDAPDPTFLYELALPPGFVYPANLPRKVALVAPPGTGAYRVAGYTAPRGSRPGRLVLSRNRRFRVFAPEDTGGGSPDRIVATLGEPVAQQLAAVEDGRADVVSGTFPPSSVRRLALLHPAQLHTDSLGQTEYMFLNTRVPPFDRIDARRAVNEAVDRSALARLLGGSDAVRPTCQILPPDFPGYQPYCPYGLQPSSAGTWTGPNVQKAAALVAASGTRGARVQVWAPADHAAVARYFAELLDRIGYRASARIFATSGRYYDAVLRPGTRAQIGWTGWIKDYISPEDFIVPLFSCSGIVPASPPDTTNLSRFCDPRLERTIATAERTQQVDTIAGQEAWTSADRMIVDRAAAVPYANDLMDTLLSARARNYQFNPEWGVLLDQLWVR